MAIWALDPALQDPGGGYRESEALIHGCRSCGGAWVGTYFDAGELEGVFAFVRSGGLALGEQLEARESVREQVHRAQITRVTPTELPLGRPAPTEIDLLVSFLRWVGRWLREVRLRRAR